MKELFPIFLLFITSVTEAQWEWQNPLPQGATMYTVITLSQDRAIVTGRGGTILTTQDGGINWHIQRLQNVDIVRKYSFVSKNEGWILGNWFDITTFNTPTNAYTSTNKIFKTYDGGINWYELSVSIDIDFSVYSLDDIKFIDKKTGYLLANPTKVTLIEEQDLYPGIIYKTDDGGTNWKEIDIGIKRKYYQIEFIDSLCGFLLSQSYYSNFDFKNNLLHKTEDGGKTWVTFSDTGYGRINFINKRTAWAGNYKTIDSGKTWNYIEFNFPQLGSGVEKISFVDSLIGFAISQKSILKTENGGIDWLIQKETENGLLQDIQFYNPQIGYACGYGGTIYRTDDSGENWIRFGEGTTEELEDIDFIDENIGWIAGANGIILYTNSGGNIWEKQIVPEECKSTYFRGIDFINEDKGWMVGGYYILYTENGGKNWDIQQKIDLNDGRFMDIKFLDENIGFAIGQEDGWFGNGIIFKTSDGGKNWEKNDDSNLPLLNEIYFIDNDYGWICGQGILLSTQDAGENWNTNYFRENLKYIQFTDREHGWISALDEGAVYQTSDGGQNWKNIPFENRYAQFFNSFHFFNANEGIATGYLYCNIFTTVDGGENWTYMERLPQFQLNSIVFANDTLGWAIGRQGAIIKFKGSYFGTSSVDIDNTFEHTSVKAGTFPNPFNSSTKIYFLLSQPQKVTISIYNILGKRINTITVYNTAKGKNEFLWQPNNIASGLYFIKIQCDEFTDVIKSVYLK